MTQYDYTAILRTGARVSGTEAANSADEVVARLQERQTIPLRVHEARVKQLASVGRIFNFVAGGKGNAVVMTAELCTLISAGLTIDRALSIALGRTSSAGLRDVLTRVRDAVRGGQGLADAMAREPATFSRVYIALVRAGEHSGRLDQALGRLHGYLFRADALRHQLRSALIYPAALLLTAAASLLLLANFVVPQFVPMFVEAGKPLPAPTRVLLATNHFFAVAWPYLAVSGVIAFYFARRALAVEATKVRAHAALLHVPIIGPLWRNMEAARLARTAAALLQSGVAIPAALGVALQVVTNAAIRRGGAEALGRIREGASVSDALQRADILPELSIQLLAVGEETGQLDEMFLKQADLLDEAAGRRVATLLALLVPGLTIAIGLVVGSVMVAVMLAVLQLNELVG